LLLFFLPKEENYSYSNRVVSELEGENLLENMKGFSPVGHGGPFSSSSNLSPLAPPFTVDPSFPRPTSNPLGHTNFHDPGYCDPHYTFSAMPSQHNWQSPTFTPNGFGNPNPSSISGHSSAPIHPPIVPPATANPSPIVSLTLGTKPIRPIGAPPASAYGQSSTNFFNRQSVSGHFHPQYPSSVQDNCNSLDLNECASAFPTTAPIGGFWNEMSSSEHWKGKDMNVSLPPSYASLEIATADGISAFEQPSNVWLGKSVELMAGKCHVRSKCTNLVDGKPLAASNENFRDASYSAYDKSRISMDPVSLQDMPYHPAPSPDFDVPYHQAPSPDFDVPCHREPSPDFMKESWSQLNPGSASYGRYFTGFSSGKSDPLRFYPASSNSSVDPVYESPLINDNSTTSINRNLSTNMSPIGRPRDVCAWKVAPAVYHPSNTGCIQASTDRSEVYGDTSSISDGVEENNRACVDPSVLKNIVSLQINPLITGDRLKKVFKAKCKVQGKDFDPPGTCVAAETEEIDSGECSSEVVEQFNPGVDSPCWKGASGSRYSLFGAAEPGHPYIPVNSDNVVPGTKKFFEEDGSSSFHKQSSPVLGLSSENIIQRSNSGKTDGGSNVEPSQNIKIGHHERNDVSKQHIDINLTEPLLGPFRTSAGCPLSSAHVQTVVNSIYSLSEWLLSYCSKDEESLKELDYMVIQKVVQNLDTLIRDDERSMPKSQFLQSSAKQTNVNKGTSIGRSQVTEVNRVQSRCYTQNACMGKKNLTASSVKEDSSPLLSFSSGDPDFEQDDMTKGIKKILEENFLDEVEPDDQNLLYKNLWLEAEAALCSIKYKARFARTKIEMVKVKQNQNQTVGEAIGVVKLPSAEVTVEVNGDDIEESRSKENEDSEVLNISLQDPEKLSAGHVNDVDTSVLARFEILKSRINNTIPANKEGQVHSSIKGDIHAGIEGTLSYPYKGGEEIVMKPQQPKIVNLGFAERRNPWPFIRDNLEVSNIVNLDHYSVDDSEDMPSSNLTISEQQELMEFGIMQSAPANMLVDRLSSGEGDSPSSDWEHVLKEATWPSS
ncbi:Peroxidase, partial [Thalictrum thalictroides]